MPKAKTKGRKLRVWTEAYRPFMFGGDVNAPIGAEVWAEGPISLGRGVGVYVVASPKGTIHIAEASTGAFVGTSLTQVREDFRTANMSVVRKQIADAKKRMERVDWIGEEHFWTMFREKG